MSAVPLLNAVPGLGAPVVLIAIVKRTAEFPQGLVRGPGGKALQPQAMCLMVG